MTRPPYLLSGNGSHSMGWLGVPTCIKTTHSQINHFQQIQIRFLGITNIVTLTNIMKKTPRVRNKDDVDKDGDDKDDDFDGGVGIGRGGLC